MLYRVMDKSGQKLSILGYGCMRLPVQEDGHVDKKEAIAEIRYAIDHGVNYLDTAYLYHNGESETVLGEALKGGYREKVKIATKLPSYIIESREQMDVILNDQLKKLQTDHIDYYLIHNLDGERWSKMQKLGIADFLDKALADGRICFAGFSFHGTPDSFPEIVDGYNWTFCQIQYNYLDEEYQAGTAGLTYATSKGLGIVVMEPLRGGVLAKTVPEADKVWAEAEVKRTPVEWGLHWAWHHPEVSVVLSGMSSMDQVKENLEYAEKGLPGTLTQNDLAIIERVKEIYRARVKVPCTSCGYCLPCSGEINIPECFARLNNVSMFGNFEQEKNLYALLVRLGIGKQASECIECGQCEEKCPQHIPISEKLKDVAELFDA